MYMLISMTKMKLDTQEMRSKRLLLSIRQAKIGKLRKDRNCRKDQIVNDKKYQIGGLVGFIFSGLFFTASSIKAGDPIAVLGSLIWIGSCIVWLIPVFNKNSKDKATD